MHLFIALMMHSLCGSQICTREQFSWQFDKSHICVLALLLFVFIYVWAVNTGMKRKNDWIPDPICLFGSRLNCCSSLPLEDVQSLQFTSRVWLSKGKGSPDRVYCVSCVMLRTYFSPCPSVFPWSWWHRSPFVCLWILFILRGTWAQNQISSSKKKRKSAVGVNSGHF